MNMRRPSSLSVTYYDPEAEPVSEPEPQDPVQPEPPKRRGRPPGSKNKPKTVAKKRDIPWYRIIWTLIWWAVATISVLSLYHGVLGWLGQSAAYITLSVSVVGATILLNRHGKRMREPL